jgi:hypothetical protein
MSNFTPDNIFKAAFNSKGSMVPNDELWRKLETELLEDANKRAASQKRKRRAVVFMTGISAMLIAGIGYVAVTNTNTGNDAEKLVKNNTTTPNTASTPISSNNAVAQNQLNNNTANLNTTPTNNISAAATVSYASIPNGSTIIERNNANHTTTGTSNNIIENAVENDEAVVNNFQRANVIELTTPNIINTTTENTLSVSGKRSIADIPLAYREAPKGYISTGLSVTGSIIKTTKESSLGYNIQVQHQKRLSDKTALVSGAGFIRMPLSYSYTKVAPKEGLPLELNARLYELSVAYVQFGINYFPKVFNKTKPNLGIAFYAMPGILTNVKASTNAGSEDIDRKMEKQINRSYFAAGIGITKRITNKLWTEVGGTYSFSTLTNGVFVNKTNAVNNVAFAQVGLKYKF